MAERESHGPPTVLTGPAEDTLGAALARARARLGPGAHVEHDGHDGLCRVRIRLGPARHGHTPQWGVAAHDSAYVAAGLDDGVARLLDDRALLARRRPLPGPLSGPALLTPPVAGILVHECFGHTSEADNYLAQRQALGRSLGDEWTRARLTVRDRPTARPYAGSYLRDDEDTAPRTVTLVRDGRWSALLTSRATQALSAGSSTGHGRGVRDAVVPRCSVLDVAPGPHTGAELLERVGDGWLLGTAVGGFSVREHLILEALWARRVRDGRPTDDIVGPVAVCAPKAALARQITAVGSDVRVHSSPYTCVKDGHEVGSTLISPSLLLARCVVRPLEQVRRLVRRTEPSA
ncbi:metallopeptidase TldD-related protein [Streptomyces sp. NPDC005727]|uniref:metallopeptidase TldD-related protein n=1 Tax=Streptomyces sp. NPDC005727 TaxID=3157053 RepID=UPI0033E044D4